MGIFNRKEEPVTVEPTRLNVREEIFNIFKKNPETMYQKMDFIEMFPNKVSSTTIALAVNWLYDRGVLQYTKDQGYSLHPDFIEKEYKECYRPKGPKRLRVKRKYTKKQQVESSPENVIGKMPKVKPPKATESIHFCPYCGNDIKKFL